ncbi:TetR/AcrR family transcriptional regulator [Salinicoccus sp. Marseille-QA3877]
MKEAFRKLDNSRQVEIMNAALAEFAAYGYEDASTNSIVKRADMSKGMLYYYFQNKESLYYACTEYALENVNTALMKRDYPRQGFIERSALIARLKKEYYDENPEISQFITQVYLYDSVPETFRSLLDELVQNGFEKMYEDVDLSYFRDDVSHETLMKLITWTIEGYSKHVEEEAKGMNADLNNLDPLWEEFDEYLTALKKIYYKEEYQ